MREGVGWGTLLLYSKTEYGIMERASLDRTDEQILSILNEDARTPDSTIGAELGIPVAEVTERIDRLQDVGVISGFTAMLDPAELGYISVAFGFSVEPGRTDKIAEQLREFDNIYKLWILSGRHNIVAHANFRDITEFQEFSSEALRQIDGISNYESSIATKAVVNEGDVVLSGE